MRLDEMTNDELRQNSNSEHELKNEDRRLEGHILRLVTTGADLSYFIERQRIIRSLLNSGKRDPRLGA